MNASLKKIIFNLNRLFIILRLALLKPLNYNKNADSVFSLFYESILDGILMRKEKKYFKGVITPV